MALVFMSWCCSKLLPTGSAPLGLSRPEVGRAGRSEPKAMKRPSLAALTPQPSVSAGSNGVDTLVLDSPGPSGLPGPDGTTPGLAPEDPKRSEAKSVSAGAGSNLPPLVDLDLVWIHPGQFTMGSREEEPGRRSDEGPRTVVRITHEFWLGKYEVTCEQWIAVMGLHPTGPQLEVREARLPVQEIPWHLATNFCGRLTQYERNAGRLPEGYTYRLPTEAEWEYACRAGTTTRFSYGDDPLSEQLLLYADFRSPNLTNAVASPAAVGSKLPNPWGLYDMHGNVEEWCLDWLPAYPGGTIDDLVGMIWDGYHIVRGGCWKSSGQDCRSAARWRSLDSRHFSDNPDAQASVEQGFRVALAPELR
jgi:formylglycine-generating enzyme required for sulfatase activity